jgi:hypothetical protein
MTHQYFLLACSIGIIFFKVLKSVTQIVEPETWKLTFPKRYTSISLSFCAGLANPTARFEERSLYIYSVSGI